MHIYYMYTHSKHTKKSKSFYRYVAYTLPGTVGRDQFVYMDPSTNTWTLSHTRLTDPKQAIGYTLDQIYNSQSKVNFL